MSIIDEALRKLREDDFDDEEEYIDDEITKILNDRFLNTEVTIQVDGGGEGPDEWYDEDEFTYYVVERKSDIE